jgi:hypothetical protein
MLIAKEKRAHLSHISLQIIFYSGESCGQIACNLMPLLNFIFFSMEQQGSASE